MSENSPYDVLFEPVRIGPVTARNRFYQVPHCCGMGHLRPNAHAAMRGVKAEGGWAVVSTEETEIHPSSDLSPYAEQRLWDARDIPALRLMTDRVRDGGALSAVELAHNGFAAMNYYSRIPPLAPQGMPIDTDYPKQARAMNKRDIAEFRKWHRNAALNAKAAGFDIIYVYAGHNLTLTQHFLNPVYNDRTDEYGGSFENRVRLIRELLEETKDAVGDTCGIAFRFAVDELKGQDGIQAQEEGRAVVEYLSDLPDIWDVNVSDWSNDSQTTRVEPTDGYQIPYIEFVKKATDKPVVAVGRLSSPDMMVSLINKGIIDFIGAARPSIADPYLPNKIRENRIEDIRECIGCNICVSSDKLGIPIRCTQNPTMGEEWRRSWHPEKIEPKAGDTSALIVGSGPAGLECALQLSRRGYQVTLAEASDDYGGRAKTEAQLIGLSAWRRVRDNRVYELQQKSNVDMFLESELSAADVLEFGFPNVFFATGSTWRADGIGRSSRAPITGLDQLAVLTPDDIMAGHLPEGGSVVIYDDENGYMGGVIAEHLLAHGVAFSFVTSESIVSSWTAYTMEQRHVQAKLIKAGMPIHKEQTLAAIKGSAAHLSCTYTGQISEIECKTLILVTERRSNDVLAHEVQAMIDSSESCPIQFTEIIGDALAPGLIADAVFAGHLAARNFEADPEEVEKALFRRELPALGAEQLGALP